MRAGDGENIPDTVIVDVIAEPMEELSGYLFVLSVGAVLIMMVSCYVQRLIE